MKGAAGQRRVPAEYFVDLDIPLPSLPEQERIAGILDTADALRVKRRESIAQLDALVQSTFLEMFGDPIGNPKQLDTASLGELGRWRSGGTPPRTRPDYFSGKIPWFSSGELNSRFVTASEENISETAIAETSAKLVESMSVMIGMYDTAALKTSVALVPCSCNQAVAFAKLDETKAHPVYVEAALRIGRESFKRLQRGVRQKNLNLTILRSIKLPIPSRDAQAAFATVVDRCEALSAVHLRHLAELDTLFASLQSRAFAGEL